MNSSILEKLPLSICRFLAARSSIPLEHAFGAFCAHGEEGALEYLQGLEPSQHRSATDVRLLQPPSGAQLATTGAQQFATTVTRNIVAQPVQQQPPPAKQPVPVEPLPIIEQLPQSIRSFLAMASSNIPPERAFGAVCAFGEQQALAYLRRLDAAQPRRRPPSEEPATVGDAAFVEGELKVDDDVKAEERFIEYLDSAP